MTAGTRPAAVLALVALALWAAALLVAARNLNAGPPEREAGMTLDPNTAEPCELERLPGVGPAISARIAEERENGPYMKLEDLLRVRGVTPGLLERLRPHVAFGGEGL